MPRYSYAILSFALFAIYPLAGFSQAPPSADAYVTNTQPASNFGNSTFLPVQAGTTSYIRLNLAALPPNASIAKATLRLYVSAVAASGSFDVFQVDGIWSEKGITFGNAPQLGVSATGGHPVLITAASLNQFVLVDITSIAQSWLNGSLPNYGIAIALAGVNGSFAFDSKESTGTAHQAELEVILAGSGDLSSPLAAVTVTEKANSRALVSGTSDPYIDNGTALQSGANFNIDGAGSAAVFNATSQFQLGGSTVLGLSGSSTLSVGTGAGQSNTGFENLFVGTNAGLSNTTANFGTFIGTAAGENNTTGDFNTFIGREAGQYNTTGTYNNFVGSNAGYLNTTGNFNNFVGTYSGANNTTGSNNNFVGIAAGQANTTGTYNNFVGIYAGQSNTTGTFNDFIGNGAGQANTAGHYNTIVGNNSGSSNTTGQYNAFLGGASGALNTSGSGNVFIGMNAGFNNTTGSSNVFVGPSAGFNAGPAANNNVYISHQGQSGEDGAIRIGDPSNQTSAYLAGVSGSSTNSGVPVFVDSTGKLGTTGGSVNFTQVTGTLSSPQLTGTYSNTVTLSNATNVFDGSFTGNGSGLTGVTSGLSWPIVFKSGDYTVQTSDFSTPSSYGKYLILTGSAAHTFTLPNPAPPNGSCVAIGDFAAAPINSNINVFLTISGNGLQIEGTSTNGTSTQPRRNSYLYCSDGAGYWRLDRQLASPSQIGPVLYTQDRGTQDAMKTTFVAGLDFGLNTGTTIFILPAFANATNNPTLDVNGLGAQRILRYGNQRLAPGDLSATALAVLIYDGQFWQLVNPQTVIGTVTSVTATAPLVSTGGATPSISCPTCTTTAALTGTTGNIGGSALTAGSCSSGTASVTGAVVGHPVAVSASDGSLPNGLIVLSAAVTSPSTVTVQLCATGSVTPVAKAYNVTTQ